jgi:hypothetical protein
VPTPFDRAPDSIRDLVVVRPRRPGPVHHRVRRCNLGHLEEWRSPGEDLPRMSRLNNGTQRSIAVPPMPQSQMRTCRWPWWEVKSHARLLERRCERVDWHWSYPPPSNLRSGRKWTRCRGRRRGQCRLRRQEYLPKAWDDGEYV